MKQNKAMDKFGLSEIQPSYSEMKLRRLTGLEKEKIEELRQLLLKSKDNCLSGEQNSVIKKNNRNKVNTLMKEKQI